MSGAAAAQATHLLSCLTFRYLVDGTVECLLASEPVDGERTSGGSATSPGALLAKGINCSLSRSSDALECN